MTNSKLFILFTLCAALLCSCAAAGAPSAAQPETAVYTEPTEFPTETKAVTQPEVPDDGAVHVADVDSFLAAIAPDTEIVLAPGVYDLTEAKNYGRGGGQWYHWENTFDGYELVITDAAGLTIRGGDPSAVTIATQPRYANVLRFDNVSDFRIAEITVGHTVEQGSCAGGVLLFENSHDLEIQSARLYGCGIRGVDLHGCKNVHVDCTDIYECSEGCVYVERSVNVLFENSKFYNCTLWNGVFEIYGSQDVAVINSEVFGNSGIYQENGCLISSSCQGVYLGGLDVHDNQFSYVFSVTDNPVTVEKCRIYRPSVSWASELFPVSPEGAELSTSDLSNMSLRMVQWSPSAASQISAPEAGMDGKVHVSTVDEFLAAIDHNTTIYLEPGLYDLSTASNYGSYGGDHYQWSSTYDGPELLISNVSGLTIEGPGAEQVSIVTLPRYANVLRFDNCRNLILRGVTAGHSEAPSECAGAVIQLTDCANVNIEGCSLYGCGILGVLGLDSTGLGVIGTEIYGCSSGAVWLYACTNVTVDACNIHDNYGIDFYADIASRNVLFEGTPSEELIR